MSEVLEMSPVEVEAWREFLSERAEESEQRRASAELMAETKRNR